MTTSVKIGYAGMTHLGLCSAIAAASKGFTTTGFDVDADLVRRLERGSLPVIEPELDDLLRGNHARLSFTADATQLQTCDLIYVAPDVPTDDQGRSDLAGLESLLTLVLSHTRKDAVIVILSQVPPGFTRSRRQDGRLIYYQVETLVFGRAVERATQPERFIVGSPDPDSALPPAFAEFLRAFNCPILPMQLESAELTKISINCCLVASVSVANTLAEICERIGADWSEIVPALKLDKRIGMHAYLVPGMGVAGGNLERDLATVLSFSEEYGTDASVIDAFARNSQYRKDWALRTLHETLFVKSPKAVIGILGLTYKENTHSVKNSPSLALIQHLTPWALRIFDPAIDASVTKHPAAISATSPLEAAQGVDALVIMTPWPEFRELACVDLVQTMRGRLVLDPYRVLDPKSARAAGLNYRTLGML